jgi:hypothetical protein
LTTTFHSGIEMRNGSIIVNAHNTEAAWDMDPYVPAVITGQIYNEADPALHGPICLSVRKILAADSGEPFVIPVEGIARGCVGPVVLMGGCLAYVKGTGAGAGIVGSSSVVALDSGGSGANVLWQGTPAGGISLSLIVVGAGGGGWRFYIADLPANLPEVDAPALGYCTDVSCYYLRDNVNGWIPMNLLAAFA